MVWCIGLTGDLWSMVTQNNLAFIATERSKRRWEQAAAKWTHSPHFFRLSETPIKQLKTSNFFLGSGSHFYLVNTWHFSFFLSFAFFSWRLIQKMLYTVSLLSITNPSRPSQDIGEERRPPGVHHTIICFQNCWCLLPSSFGVQTTTSFFECCGVLFMVSSFFFFFSFTFFPFYFAKNGVEEGVWGGEASQKVENTKTVAAFLRDSMVTGKVDRYPLFLDHLRPHVEQRRNLSLSLSMKSCVWLS